MLPRHAHPAGVRGQVLAIFALALVAIIAMTGLVLDGGSLIVQRRDQQNVADSAAMAGAYAWLDSGSATNAEAAAQDNAADNGFTNGANNVAVTVAPGLAVGGGYTLTVTVLKPHRNWFAGIVGMSTWDVSTTATSFAGYPNAAIGAMPIIFNKKGFPNGIGPTNEVSFDEPGNGNEDVPQEAGQFNWTVFCLANGNACNANTNDVREIMNNENERGKEVKLSDSIGPLNAGSHTALFSDLAAFVGWTFPVAIVDDDGHMDGWAMFHLTGSVGGSTKQIRGYFEAPVTGDCPGNGSHQCHSSLYIAAGGGTGTGVYGTYDVRLTN